MIIRELHRFVNKSFNDDAGSWHDERGMVELDENGYYQVWLMGTGFYLSSDNFLLFVNLMR